MNTDAKYDITHSGKREQYLGVINKFATVLLDAKTIDEVVWSVAKNAIAELGYVDCVIYLLDEKGEYLIQRAAHGEKNPVDLDILNPIKIKVGEGIVGDVARTGKGSIVSDTSKDERYIVDDNMRFSEITIPIISGHKVIGVIDSEHPEKNFFPDDHLELLNTIASMTATKLIQTKFNEELQVYQTELKYMVLQKTEELRSTLSELETQKAAITSSINYAKRIQQAILRPTHKIREFLPQSFILYSPKDIVAGDFYWMEKVGDLVIFAAADCTGHGVPGALISVVCHNAMNRVIREFGLTDPAAILHKTRELVIETFESSTEEVRDGMDIALCVLDQKTNVLKYAGANISLHYIRNGEITDVKADKQPIGRHVNTKPFTNHTIQLLKGDAIYLFTDGIADQFGGPAGKKLKYKQFRKLLLTISDKPLDEQCKIINDMFQQWKGNLEQVDDICIIGVRI